MPSPGSPNPYGYDLSCGTDLTPDAAEVGGVHVLSLALLRRASTPRGSLIYDPNYGYDLGELLNDDINVSSDVGVIGSNLDTEFLKDPRVYASQTFVTFSPSGTLTTNSSVTPAYGPAFKLVLSVGSLNSQGVQILSVTPT